MNRPIRLLMAEVADCAAEAEQTDAGWLSRAETERLQRIRAPARRSQFLAGHWLARQALASFSGAGPQQHWAVTANAAGAPLVSCHPHLFLSLSHSANWVVCAVSDAPIGIDIEAPAKPRDWRRLAPTVFSPAELDSAQDLAPTDAEQQFYRIWTLKEAWFKSRGEGLALQQLPALHTQPMPAEQGNAQVWQSEGVTLALVAAPGARVRGDGLPAAAPSYWQVGSG